MKNIDYQSYAKLSGSNPFGTQAKLMLHFKELHQYLATGDTDCPIFMEVGLTNRCNMECYWCITENSRDNRYGANIDLNVLKQFLKDFSDMGGKAITFAGQGEPTYYPHFEEATSYAHQLGLKLGLMTNGVYKKRYNELIGESFDWIRISLDTLDAESYKKWKNVDGVKTVMNNVDALGAHPVTVGINCNVGPDITIDHAKELISWATATDAIAYLQFRPLLPRYFKKEEKTTYAKSGVAEINQEVWNYLDKQTNNKKLNFSDDKRSDLTNGTAFDFRSCEGHFFEPILDATGEVKICTYHPKDKRLSFGNINESRFSDIWKSEQRNIAIKFIRGFDYKANCQICCKLCEPNKLIDFLTHPEEMKDRHFL